MRSTTIGENVRMDKSIIAEDVTVGNDVVIGCGEEAPNVLKPAVYAFGLGWLSAKTAIPGVKIGKNTAISGVTTEKIIRWYFGSGQSIAAKDGEKGMRR